MMILKYAIANLRPDQVAGPLQEAGFNGSITTGFGFGQWGMEPTVFVEMALSTTDLPKVQLIVAQILFKHREECAYVTVNGLAPALLYSSGAIKAL